MPRDRSPNDDSDNDPERQEEREQELAALQNRYRVLLKDKRVYAQECEDLKKRQSAEIKRLDKEHSELELNKKLIEDGSNKRRNEGYCKNLGNLGTRKIDCEKEIEEEKKKQAALDVEIRELEDAQANSSTKRGGSGKDGSEGGGRGSAPSSGHADSRKLENQLQLSKNRFGKLLESNRTLRKEIDNLRVERQRFDNLYQRLMLEKEELERSTSVVIETSTQAFNDRLEAQEKMQMVKDKNEKEIQQHNAEMKELRRVIDHDLRLQIFMTTKTSDRDEDETLVLWRSIKEEREAEKKKASQTDSVESYEAAFTRIKEITQEDDINLIVNNFIEAEDRNFALFNYVGDQNNRIDDLRDEIEKVREDMRNYKKEGQKMEKSREKLLKELEREQTVASKDAEKYLTRNTELRKILDEVKINIGTLFKNINCDRTKIDDMLVVQEGVTDQNVLLHLGVIEETTNKLLLLRASIKKEVDLAEFLKKPHTLLGKGPRPKEPEPPHKKPLPPPLMEDTDVHEERPLDKEEIKRLITLEMTRKQDPTHRTHHDFDTEDRKSVV